MQRHSPRHRSGCDPCAQLREFDRLRHRRRRDEALAALSDVRGGRLPIIVGHRESDGAPIGLVMLVDPGDPPTELEVA
jgi:hypothetical protein